MITLVNKFVLSGDAHYLTAMSAPSSGFYRVTHQAPLAVRIPSPTKSTRIYIAQKINLSFMSASSRKIEYVFILSLLWF